MFTAAKKNNKNGICTLVSKKKKPFLGEKKFFEHFGFKVVDAIEDFELIALPFNNNEHQNSMKLQEK